MSTNQLDKKSEAWSALFSEPMSELVKRYTASVFFDQRLWLADITGSLAHAEMLAAQNIISQADRADIAWRRFAPKSKPVRSTGNSISKTCI
jgi:argininosuccinate lyase